MRYMKVRIGRETTERRLRRMIASIKPVLIKLESASTGANNRTIRYALGLKKRGFSIRDVRLFTRYKRSRSRSREHYLIAVTLADEAQRGGFKRSEPEGDEAEVKEVKTHG